MQVMSSLLPAFIAISGGRPTLASHALVPASSIGQRVTQPCMPSHLRSTFAGSAFSLAHYPFLSFSFALPFSLSLVQRPLRPPHRVQAVWFDAGCAERHGTTDLLCALWLELMVRPGRQDAWQLVALQL